jgi:hypothetical protein
MAAEALVEECTCPSLNFLASIEILTQPEAA